MDRASALAAALLIDGWFDCTTAQSADRATSLWSLVGEVSAAALFFWLAASTLRSITAGPSPRVVR